MKKFTLISMPLCVVVLAMLLALTPGPVQAQVTGPLSDVVTVTAPGIAPFIFTFSETVEEPVLELLELPGPLPGFGAVVLLEPAFEPCPVTPTLPQGCISDILFLNNNGLLFFVSDDDVTALEGILAGLPVVPTFLLETGLPQDVTLALGIAPTSGINVTVQSDVSAVPEPSTWILLGSGLAGLAYWKRRRT